MKRRAKVILIAVLLAGIAAMILGFRLYSCRESWAVSRELSVAMKTAQSVTLVEFEGKSLEVRQELVFQRVPATTKQIDALKKATGPWFAPNPSEAMACFEPHHRVEVSNADGTVLQFNICFSCDNFSLGSHFGSLPKVWIGPLRSIFTDAGMPRRSFAEYAAMVKSHPDYEQLVRKQREIEARIPAAAGEASNSESQEAIRKIRESRKYSKEMLEHMKSQAEP